MEYIHTLKMNAIAPSGTQVSGPLNYSNVFKCSKHHALFNVKTHYEKTVLRPRF